MQGFFQKNGFQSFQAADGGAGKLLPIDGQYHDLSYSLEGLTSMNVVDQTGINLFSHADEPGDQRRLGSVPAACAGDAVLVGKQF